MAHALEKVTAVAVALSLFGAPLVLAQESPQETPAEEASVAAAAPEATTESLSVDTAESDEESATSEEVLPGSFGGNLKGLSIIAAEEEWQNEHNKEPDAPAPPETGVGIQATFDAQEAIEGETLQGTANPETSTSTEAEVVPVVEPEATSTEETEIPVVPEEESSAEELGEESTSTPITAAGGQTATAVIAGVASLEVLDGDIAEGEAVEPESIDVIVAFLPEPVAEAIVAEVEAEPEPEFTFALTGKQIPTKKTEATSSGFSQGDEEIDTALTPIIDNETGVMNITGQCADAYFVVLLFKEERDYARDPRSYILNQAFPCENGQFSYSISELPHTLPSGTYYLLVGQQGIRGAWTPITSLTEITISNRN